ncbi:MAG: D-alpha,beta-D-heptose 1,7-bisphosphate phosphatase [Candidatus Peregrinibacteria bacterium GW2011_GWC2_39_14]|nr:MAG: D-alpha,beta-D-heptose 1,7-bisphosphate phosphatase [Candidatus Peregrinibacteria bacterium GW2011_GWC2_39_14]
MNTKRAIFLDRDGVINDTIDRGENCFVQGKKVRWTAPWTYSEFHLKQGVTDALDAFHEMGYLVILVTNQPDITYGTMTREDHGRIMAEVRQLPLDDIFVCEHGRDDGCECKKPKPGMLFDAAKKWGIDLAQSFMVGDTKSDASAGRAAGCKVVMVNDENNNNLDADFKVSSLQEVQELIED